MNHLVVLPEEFVSEKEVKITGTRARYVGEFHRVTLGEEYAALVYGKESGVLRCLALEEGEYRFSYSSISQVTHQSQLTLIQGICRPQSMKKVLQLAAMFRFQELLITPTEYGEKSYRQSKIFEGENSRYEIIKGLEQVGNPYPPKVEKLRDLRTTLQHVRDSPQSQESLCFFGHPSDSGLSLADTQINLPVVLAIGPEQGWSDAEVKVFEEFGFKRISLGADHYRIEVSIALIYGQLKLLQQSSLKGL